MKYFYKDKERYCLKDNESINDYCIIKGYKVKWIKFKNKDTWIKPCPVPIQTYLTFFEIL